MSRTAPLRTLGALAALVTLLVTLVPLEGAAQESFEDTSDSPHASAIEYLRANGIAKGCNPPANDRFCPDDFVTRGQMAAFFVRALDLTDRLDDPFVDDDGDTFEADIERLAAADVTKGCNPPTNDRFCPDGFVTRGQMAAFIARALDLAPGNDRFNDVDGSVFRADINAIAAAGITRGCNPPANTHFCPTDLITRAQMATFIMRGLEPESITAPQQCDVARNGPASPTGDTRVEPGESIQKAIDSQGNGATIVIAAGLHKMSGPISPAYGNHIVGERGAVLDGGGTAEFAFGGPGDDVTIEGLEIRNYASPVTEGTVRTHNSSKRWVIRANEIHNNAGQGIKFGEDWRIVGNYIHHNEQYGIGGAGNNVVVESNEIAFNNHDLSVSPYHGAGGTKFVRTENLLVKGNCSHNNGGPGLWTDGHNIDTRYEGNLVFDNHHAGIKHEVSCDASIVGNTVRGNGFGNPHWVAGAGILVANSPNVTVRGNLVEDNHDGIGGIQGERDTTQGLNCEILLKNLLVTDNQVVMSSGHTGIVTNDTGMVWDSSWNNRFVGNEYSFASAGHEYFRWESKTLTYAEWKKTGND
ncbi:MAG: right-handed parallel beta-helix repeat-containing protein [Actinomycetota bacterium]